MDKNCDKNESNCEKNELNFDIKESNCDTKDSHSNKKDCQKEWIAMRNSIINMRSTGRSMSWIAREMKISRNTVSKWIHRWKSGSDLKDLPRSGAPRKTSQEQDQNIAKEATNNDSSNTKELKDRLNLSVSVSTVKRRLIEQGIRKLSPAQEQKWANEQKLHFLHVSSHMSGYLKKIFLI